MKPFLIAAFLALASLSSGCSYLTFGDGPYQGRVVDQKTRKPIEGAAVLAIWWRESASITQPKQSVHDAQEALTDKEGNFSIAGPSKLLLSPQVRIKEPVFIIFKLGYEAIGERKLLPLEKDKGMVVQLRELPTREERLKNLRRISVDNCAREKKCPNLMKLKDLEATYLGLEPTDLTK